MDIQLLLALVLGIATIIVLVLRTRLDAFVALLIAALVTGIVAGQAPAASSYTTARAGRAAGPGLGVLLLVQPRWTPTWGAQHERRP